VSKISQYSALGALPATNDLLVMVDVDDTAMASSGTTFSMTMAEVLGFVQQQTGCVTPSGDTSGTTDTANIRAALADYGGCFLYPGSYYVTPGQTTASSAPGVSVGPGQFLRGYGAGSTVIYPVGGSSGQAAVTFRNPAFPATGGGDPFASSNLVGWNGGFSVDGSHGSGAPSGVHGIEMGDIYLLNLMNVCIRNFTGANSIGLRVNNTIGWTERAFCSVSIDNCAHGMTWCNVDGGGGHSAPSMAYSHWWVSMHQNANQNGFELQNGVSVYGGTVQLGGNFYSGSGSNTGIALIIGQDGNGGNIQTCIGNICFETDGASGGSNVQFTDMYIGTNASLRIAGNLLFRGSTPIVWQAGTATPTQVTVTGFCQTAALGFGGFRPLKSTGNTLTPSATANTLGTALTINPSSGWQSLMPTGAWWSIAGIGAETITLSVTANNADGTTNTMTTSGTTDLNNSEITNAQFGTLLKSNVPANSFTVAVESSIASSGASVTFSMIGLNLQ